MLIWPIEVGSQALILSMTYEKEDDKKLYEFNCKYFNLFREKRAVEYKIQLIFDILLSNLNMNNRNSALF